MTEFESYKNVVVEFQGSCPEQVCKRLKLENKVSCPLQGENDSIKCDYGKLVELAEETRGQVEEIPLKTEAKTKEKKAEDKFQLLLFNSA